MPGIVRGAIALKRHRTADRSSYARLTIGKGNAFAGLTPVRGGLFGIEEAAGLPRPEGGDAGFGELVQAAESKAGALMSPSPSTGSSHCGSIANC